MQANNTAVLQKILSIIPSLSKSTRKGKHGRIGIMGGSFEYTGAPFYAGISSLKTGADLCHILCVEEAAIPIKSYSPELIVHPLLKSEASLRGTTSEKRKEELHYALDEISKVLQRLDVLVIGPGLGRELAVQELIKEVIHKNSLNSDPTILILDGDALFALSLDISILHGSGDVILTPNGMEYARLCAATGLISSPDPTEASKISPLKLSQALNGPVIVQKGHIDQVSDGEVVLSNDQFGCPRRCGGQGDVLAGSIATFAAWSREHTKDELQYNPLLLAGYGGSLLTRASAKAAFQMHFRSMATPDVLQNIGKAFHEIFGE